MQTSDTLHQIKPSVFPPRSFVARRYLVFGAALACLALLPVVNAVSPAPDGGYTGNNTAEGTSALFSLSSGVDNTALGFQALYHITSANYNTAEGFRALFSNTSGTQNTANGVNALISNTTGSYNTATGVNALYRNTTAGNNTATGYQALFSNTTGPFNTATGHGALYSNTTGDRNTATGDGAMFANTTGASNIAVGVSALRNNITGSANIAIGHDALLNNTTSSNNTATGMDALYYNTGSYNTATGFHALEQNTTGSTNTAVGAYAGSNVTTATDVISIGIAGGNVDDSCFIGNIRYTTPSLPNPIPVVIDGAGQLGTVSSSRRFKHDIKPMDSASEAILALKPVTFHYKTDKKDTAQFGLIAEEVAKVNPDLVVRDKDGQVYSVRYDAVNAMLLNEFLKEHGKVKEQERKLHDQETTIVQLKQGMNVLTAQVKEQAAQIRRVSTQMDMRKSSQIVFNNP